MLLSCLPHNFDMVRPLGYPFVAMADSKISTPSEDASSANSILIGMEDACSSLRFHMDNSVWDIIHEEVMDWRDSSWTSMDLPGKKTCENIA